MKHLASSAIGSIVTGAAAVGAATSMVVVMISLAGCRTDDGGTNTHEPALVHDPLSAPAATVVATYQGGDITVEDLDRAVRGRGLADSYQMAPDRRIWLDELARRLVVDRLLLEEAQLVGADQEAAMQEAERAIHRDSYSDVYLRESGTVARVTTEEIESFYQENRERYHRPERRQTYNLFKVHQEGTSREALEDELEDLRQRVLNGESFQKLAREHSESETRFRDGLLGVLERGRFSDDFDRIVFALDEGVPSAPVINSDGGHLFYVEAILEARSVELDEARVLIAEELGESKRREHLATVASSLPLPEDHFVPDPDELRELLRSGNAATPILRIGDYQLRLGHFQKLVQEKARSVARKDPQLARTVFEDLQHREIIYQHLLNEGLPHVPEADLLRRFEQQLIEHFAQKKLLSRVERSPQQVAEFFQTRQMRYATPAKLTLKRLLLPEPSTTAKIMAELESLRPRLDAGEESLEALAVRFGGQTAEMGPVTAATLEREDPTSLQFAFSLETGKHSPAYTTRERATMFQVVDRADPRPQALALVRDQVVRDYLQQYRAVLYEELSSQMLEQASFEFLL